jgi:hypothetical protein
MRRIAALQQPSLAGQKLSPVSGRFWDPQFDAPNNRIMGTGEYPFTLVFRHN